MCAHTRKLISAGVPSQIVLVLPHYVPRCGYREVGTARYTVNISGKNVERAFCVCVSRSCFGFVCCLVLQIS